MKTRSLKHIGDWTNQDYKPTTFDLGIFCLGYEERSSYLPQKFGDRCSNNLVFKFNNYQLEAEYKRNEEKIKALIGANFVELNENSYTEIFTVLTIIQKKQSLKRILVDYSCMSRMWYNAIINWVKFFSEENAVEIHFAYSFGKYKTAFSPLQIKDIKSLPGCEGAYSQRLETLAVIGIGFDDIIALNLCDIFEPGKVLTFYADPGTDFKNGKRVLEANSILVNEISSGNIPLPINSLSTSIGLLKEAILPYVNKYNVALIPIGPKPLVLASIILSNELRQLTSCIRVSGTRSPVVDVAPTEKYIVTSLTMTVGESQDSFRKQS